MENIVQGQWLRGPSADLGEPIADSLRFRNNQRLTSSNTRPTGSWTFSCWFKPGTSYLDSSRDALLTFAPNYGYQFGNSSYAPSAFPNYGGCLMTVNSDVSGVIEQLTNGTVTDPAAWYHIVLINESNVTRCYLNGVKSSHTGATPPGNSDMAIGSNSNSSQDDPLEGYLAEVIMLDGTVVSHTTTNGKDIIDEFGRFNEDGVWVPKAIEFTAAQYGAKGFRLQFQDSSNPGDDSAPTGTGHASANDWTATGFVTTALGNSQFDNDVDWNDSPTSNHCMNNPFVKSESSTSWSSANLRTQDSNTSYPNVVPGTMLLTGKHYWEYEYTTESSAYPYLGVCKAESITNGANWYSTSNNAFYWKSSNSSGYHGFSTTPTGTIGDCSTGDVVGIAFDRDTRQVQFNRNGGSFQSLSITSYDGDFVPMILGALSSEVKANFGNQAFRHTPPTGYTALQSNNLAEPTIKNGEKYFGALTYAAPGSPSYPITINGSGGNNGTGNLDFDAQPDLVWIKMRNGTENHILFDSLRGAGKSLRPDENIAESNRTNFAFATDGFTFSAADAETYQQNDSYAAWCWKAGGAPTATNDNAAGAAQDAGSVKVNGSDSSFAQGTIAVKKMSVNTTAGFSIVQYEGTGSAGSIPHGLGKIPKFAIFKRHDGTGDWDCYHESIGNTKIVKLNESSSQSADGVAYYNNTSPTSTLFTIGAGGANNTSGEDMIAYIWTDIEGFSKFGEYSGNGNADGQFVYLGFKPAFVMVKTKSGANGSWSMYDNVRAPQNPNMNTLVADGAAAQVTSGNNMDFLVNGFKCRDNGSINNGSGNVYLYMAFAEHPFGGENTAPATGL